LKGEKKTGGRIRKSVPHVPGGRKALFAFLNESQQVGRGENVAVKEKN